MLIYRGFLCLEIKLPQRKRALPQRRCPSISSNTRNQPGLDQEIALTRLDKREILREAAFLCRTPCCALRMISGCAALSASAAFALSPEAIASSTLRMCERIRERRDLLTSVRRSITRIAFLAETVLAITSYAPNRPSGTLCASGICSKILVMVIHNAAPFSS